MFTGILPHHAHFYPRSPCGERQAANGLADTPPKISIHALLAESDQAVQLMEADTSISIHALLAESDRLWIILYSCPGNFYPRSPCGERQLNRPPPLTSRTISIHALLAESDGIIDIINNVINHFYPRSPCGERLVGVTSMLTLIQFLSTLSLRRATMLPFIACELCVFLSTLSLRRATTPEEV